MTDFFPGEGEPAFTEWEELPIDQLVSRLLEHIPKPDGRPRIIAIDGRGGSGKSTLAERIADRMPRSAVVHSDDLAWAYSIFGWDGIAIEHVLGPLRAGEAIDYRPPGWVSDDRPGSIMVAAGLDLVILEGTGASRASLTPFYDATVWMQRDFAEAKRRAIDRDVENGVNGDREHTLAFWDLWQKEEVPFLVADRPWERATAVVAGASVIPLPADSVASARRTR